MPVTVEQVTSEVVPESQPAAPASDSAPGPDRPWLVLARHRALDAQVAEDARRTRAQAYDD